MNKILALSILVFSVVFVACSGDGNPSASRLGDDSVTPPSVVNDPADILEKAENAVKNNKVEIYDDDDGDDDDDRYNDDDDDDDDYSDFYNDDDFDYSEFEEYFK